MPQNHDARPFRIGTHSGSFHADDALGVAILHQLHPLASVSRTRDAEVWQTCDALVDVGGVYEVESHRFDHHQKGFSERRANGTPYAGAGLVWKTYGKDYVASCMPALSAIQREAVAADVDAKLIQFADAVDSGIDVPGPNAFGLAGIVSSFNAPWVATDSNEDQRFLDASRLAGTVLRNLVLSICAEQLAATLVERAIQEANGKGGRILLLDTPRVPYDRYVCELAPDALFVVYPSASGKQYQVRVIPEVLGQFKARADLPAGWAGLQDEELSAVTGVADAVFCHNGRFIAGAKTREGAWALAEKAVAAYLPESGIQA